MVSISNLEICLRRVFSVPSLMFFGLFVYYMFVYSNALIQNSKELPWWLELILGCSKCEIGQVQLSYLVLWSIIFSMVMFLSSNKVFIFEQHNFNILSENSKKLLIEAKLKDNPVISDSNACVEIFARGILERVVVKNREFFLIKEDIWPRLFKSGLKSRVSYFSMCYMFVVYLIIFAAIYFIPKINM